MGQYFENVNLPSKIVEYTTNVFGVNFYFKTDNGVFSKDKLDFGTRVLLESLPLSELSGDILDLGCGYGAVSIILSKMIHANFDAVDVNRRALHLLEMNKVSRCEHIHSYSLQGYGWADATEPLTYWQNSD